ncbi:MAG TPA: glycoside hydrolase family 6 protein [Actinocatenispora sp.]
MRRRPRRVLAAVILAGAVVLAGVTPAAALPSAPAVDGAWHGPSEPVAEPEWFGTADGGFYADPDSGANRWVAANPDNAATPTIRDGLASRPQAKWFGDWNTDVRSDVDAYVSGAAKAGKLPILVAYDIPQRDACGGQSTGGAPDEQAYAAWIGAFAAGIGTRPAVVVLEPDAVAQTVDPGCTAVDRAARMATLNDATSALHDGAPGARAYLDAGNATWISDLDALATALDGAGLRRIRGFALNVAHYQPVVGSEAYGGMLDAALSARLGHPTPYVVDTSRSGGGRPEPGDFCNYGDARLGVPSRENDGGGAELLLWVKDPGESDGVCGASSLPAGQFDWRYAYRLVTGAWPG